MGLKNIWAVSLIILSSLSTLACSSDSSSSLALSDRTSPTYEGPDEEKYCEDIESFSSSVTITGKAKYTYRAPFGNSSSGGLGGVESSGRPIRYAEVRVLNSSGNPIQCGETASDGAFSVSIPKNTGTYTLQVNSRSYNNKLRATIFDAPETKVFYSLEEEVSSTKNSDIGTLTASAKGNLLGGAFNILDQLLNANDYLRAQVSTCSFTGCEDFTVAPKVEVFWEKGFNPGSYLNAGALSFYLPGYSRLFILGGEDGDTDSSDTDHFDNSVIIHEYGHFLEDNMFTSDSPGGSHNGNSIIDPRLAWSEGWGDFFQAAVQNNPTYRDTIGNTSGSTDYLFYVDLEDAVSGYDLPKTGSGGALGEGNFREFSVTRLLWDALDTETDSGAETVSNGFPEIWASLVKTSGGWTRSAAAFRNVGFLHEIQGALTGGTDWSDLLALELQTGNQSEYGQYVTAQNSCTGYTYSITPVSVSGDSGLFSTSDLFRNNDFYHFRATSKISKAKFRLVYEDADNSGTVADLDFYIYNESANFGDGEDVVGYSRDEPSSDPSDSQTESLTISSLPKGHYLLNIFVYTGGSLGGAVNYKIQQYTGGSWVNLCNDDL